MKKKKWSTRDCINEAKKYDCRNDFRLGCYGAYEASKKYGILDSLFPITGNFYGVHKYWDETTIPEEAKKYKTRGEFLKGNGSAYYASKRLGLLDTLFPIKVTSITLLNQNPKKKKRNRKSTRTVWTDEAIRLEAQKYKKRGEFAIASPSAYYASKRLGILDELFPGVVYTHWTDKSLKDEAAKYPNRNTFRAECYNGYYAAYRRNKLGEIAPVMIHKKVCPIINNNIR